MVSVHRKFVPPGQTNNEKFYLQVLEPYEARIVPRQVNPAPWPHDHTRGAFRQGDFCE